MIYHYVVRADNGTTLLASERKPLDALGVSQWLNAQLFQFVTGDTASVKAVAIYGTFANDAARAAFSNTGVPSGSIYYQIDNRQYYQYNGTALVPYAWAAAVASGGTGTTTPSTVARYRYATPATPAITDASGNVWTLGSLPSGTTSLDLTSIAPTPSTQAPQAGSQSDAAPDAVYKAAFNVPNGTVATNTYSGFTPNQAVVVKIHLNVYNSGGIGAQSSAVSINGTAQTAMAFNVTGYYIYSFATTADNTGQVAVAITGAQYGTRVSAIRVG